MGQEHQILEKFTTAGYKYGFESNIDTDTAPKGLSEATIRLISAKKKGITLIINTSKQTKQKILEKHTHIPKK